MSEVPVETVPEIVVSEPEVVSRVPAERVPPRFMVVPEVRSAVPPTVLEPEVVSEQEEERVTMVKRVRAVGVTDEVVSG